MLLIVLIILVVVYIVYMRYKLKHDDTTTNAHNVLEKTTYAALDKILDSGSSFASAIGGKDGIQKIISGGHKRK